MKRYLFLILFIFLGSQALVAQTKAKVRNADKLFDNYLYQDAINTYETIRKKDDHINRKLADAYRLTGNSVKAETFYAKLYSGGNATDEDVLHYSQMLKMNAKYSEAIQLMEVCNSKVPGDDRVSDHLKDKTYYTDLLMDKGQFAITRLKMNTGESDFGTSYYGNKIVFVSSRPRNSFTKYEYNWNKKDFLNLYHFEPSAKGKDKVKKVRLFRTKGKLNQRFHEGTATFDPTGKIMLFTRDSYARKKELGSGQVRVLGLWASYKDEKGKWGKPVALPFNNKNYNVGHAAFSADGKTVYFVSDMPGGFGETDIYSVVRNDDGTWGTPVNLGDKVNTTGKEMFPFAHPGGMLFFASDGLAGLGGLDIFVAKLNGNSVGMPKNPGTPLNGPQDDFAFILDAAMKSGYFSSSREGGKGSDDIYYFDLLAPFKLSRRIEGYTLDKKDGSVLPGTEVKLYNEAHDEVGSVRSDASGYYSFEVEEEQDFSLTASVPDYTDGLKSASTKGNEDVVKADLMLEKIPQFALSVFVSDNKSGVPISNTHIVIREKGTDKVVANNYTGPDGFWKKPLEGLKLNDQLAYTIELSHDGYLSKTSDFSYTVTREGEIRVHESIDMTLGKLEIGQDIGKLINIKPIYFDLGKYTIRKDAALELDKIVAIMKEYPNMVIELGSHTDCRSSMTSNQKLSQSRAKASADYIIKQGIDKSRISGKGYGETKLLNGCACEGNVKSTCTEEEHQQNRRTEFIIVSM